MGIKNLKGPYYKHYHLSILNLIHYRSVKILGAN